MRNRICFEHIPHQCVSSIVEYGTDRPDIYHELADTACVPFARLFNVFSVHPVPRYRDLGDIIQQVLDKYLDGQHGQEWQDSAGAEHAEHIPEIAAGGHLYVLDDIAECPPAIDNAFAQHHQVFLQ